jgi:TetR/AcrR family transcriptional regulator, cholesterol catabolism regulator
VARPAAERLAGGPAADVRDQIVRSAAALFRERGYATASLRDVAAAVGLSKAGIYHHFATKEKILEAVYDRAVEVLEADLRRALTAEGIEPQLRALITGRVGAIAEEQDVMTVFWQERPWIAPEILSGLAERLRGYRHTILELIEEGQRAGVLRDDLDPHVLMLGLDGMTGWLYLWYRPGRLGVDEIGDQLWRLGWTGARNPASMVAGQPEGL